MLKKSLATQILSFLQDIQPYFTKETVQEFHNNFPIECNRKAADFKQIDVKTVVICGPTWATPTQLNQNVLCLPEKNNFLWSTLGHPNQPKIHLKDFLYFPKKNFFLSPFERNAHQSGYIFSKTNFLCLFERIINLCHKVSYI